MAHVRFYSGGCTNHSDGAIDFVIKGDVTVWTVDDTSEIAQLLGVIEPEHMANDHVRGVIGTVPQGTNQLDILAKLRLRLADWRDWRTCVLFYETPKQETISVEIQGTRLLVGWEPQEFDTARVERITTAINGAVGTCLIALKRNILNQMSLLLITFEHPPQHDDYETLLWTCHQVVGIVYATP